MQRITLVVLLAAALGATPAPRPDRAFPPGTSGQFVAVDLVTGRHFRVDPAGCAERYAPFSTFKIPNSLIGLETGVVASPDETWRWDSAKYPVPDPAPGPEYAHVWTQDQSMRSALALSIVWYYRELATRVGGPRMEKWLATFGYGNRDISGGLDRFWLGSSLRVSPDEQARFLARLQNGAFPVSKEHLAFVQDDLTEAAMPGYRLIAKTGSSGTGEGWLVGWVLRDGGGCAFALHMQARSFEELVRTRPGIARALLARAGYLPG